MRGSYTFRGGIAAVLLLLCGAGCRDQLPTAADQDLFPGGIRATTFVLDLPAAEVVEEIGRFTDYTSPRGAGFLLTAHQFEGALQANILARFTEFPQAVTYTADGAVQTDTLFEYVGGQLVAPIDTAASTSDAPVHFQLWSLAESWELESVSWEAARDTGGVRVPWQQPGGTRSRLLAEATWAPGDTILHDSIAFTMDSLAVREMTEEDFPGLLVTASSPGTRIELGRFFLRAEVRPTARPDTVVPQVVTVGPQTFVFAPEVPEPPGVWQAGGIRSSRTLFRLNLAHRFPCPAATGVPPCVSAGDSLRLADVTLNQAVLLLEPLPVEDGFRPLLPLTLSLRRVAEPELGRRAPLGERVTLAPITVEPESFTVGGGAEIAVNLTDYIRARELADTAIDLALLSEPEGTRFGLARFAPTPRLRLVYTFSITPVRP